MVMISNTVMGSFCNRCLGANIAENRREAKMAKIRPETNLVSKEEGALVRPGKSQRGFAEEIDRGDYIFPRAKLIQPTSPELTEGIEGLKPGVIINSLTKELLSPEFIPIIASKNFIRFNPRNNAEAGFDPNFAPGAMIWASNDPLDPKVKEQAQFGPNGEKPLATAFINFFSYFPGAAMPIIVSFSKTSYKTGKQLLSLAKFCGGDIFARKYQLTSVMESNSMGTFAVLKVMPIGASSPEEFAICEQYWKDFSGRVKDIHAAEEGVVEDELTREGKRPY